MARDTYEMTSPRHVLYYAFRVAKYIPPTVGLGLIRDTVLRRKGYSLELCEALGCPCKALPSIVPSSGISPAQGRMNETRSKHTCVS